MSYLVVSNFNDGLDTRRVAVTEKPGTLVICDNAHITRGGEVEKRKAFVPYAQLPPGLTFGLQAAGGNLYVFGSGATPPNQPPNVQYQRLISPQGDALSGILSTDTFNGSIYAVALFANGEIYHYYGGNRVTTWDSISQGVAGTVGVATAFAAAISKDSNFTATSLGSVTTITETSTNVPFTIMGSATPANVTEVLALGSFDITGGTAGAGNQISDVTVNSVSVLGALVLWTTSNAATATAVATQINTTGATTNPQYTATASGQTVTISAVAGSGSSPNGFVVAPVPAGTVTTANIVNMQGGVSNSPTLTVATIQNSSVAVPEVLATGTLTVTGGTSSPGTNKITSVKVNSVEVLGASVDWQTSNNATAIAIAQQIQAFAATTTPKYTATASGSVVTIQAFAGSGATPNGFALADTVAGNLTTTLSSTMSGGVSAVAALPQISTITIGGGFDPLDLYQVTLAIPSISYSQVYTVSAASTGMGTTVKTFGSKVYSTALSLLEFSQVNDPTQWGTNVNGAGFINMTNQASGSENLTGIGVFLGKMAIFSRRATQVYIMNADPLQNTQSQVLNNIGTFAPKSIVNNGDIDLFFLSDAGIRSLRPRDASNITTVSDMGTNIDTLIAADLALLTPAQRQSAVGIMEPTEGRYWLAVGKRIYVFSYFPTPGIMAWSTYRASVNGVDMPADVSDMTYNNGQIYIRAGDTIYVYGGTNNATYDASPVTVVLPFLDGGKPAHKKTFTGIDAALDGTWAILNTCDPSSPGGPIIPIANSVTGQTYFSNPSIYGMGIGTHIQIKFLNTDANYARLSNCAIHFQLAEEK